MEEYIGRIDAINLKPKGNYEIKFSLFKKSALPRPFLPQMYTENLKTALLGSFAFELSPSDWGLQGSPEIMSCLELYENQPEGENLSAEKQVNWIIGYFVDLIAEQILESGILEIYDPFEFEEEEEEDELSFN